MAAAAALEAAGAEEGHSARASPTEQNRIQERVGVRNEPDILNYMCVCVYVYTYTYIGAGGGGGGGGALDEGRSH